MLTYKGIIEQVKLSNLPYYRLRGRSDSYTSSSITIGDNLSEDAPTVEQVLKRLKQHVDTYTAGNPNFVFELDLLKTPSSNQSGKHGPFPFVKNEAAEVKENITLLKEELSSLNERYITHTSLYISL